MNEQMSIFDFTRIRYFIDKPIKLIELFAGCGAQAMSIRDLGLEFEHHVISEWSVNSIAAYKAIHCDDDKTDYSADFSKAELVEKLFNLGISADGKDPMTHKQIKGKNEQFLRSTYNNIKATHNLVNIMAMKGCDLSITDIKSFTYLLTYSFPCQDLSVAGKMLGMKEGSGTRSGMLWEVKRLLDETENLPQILLMENVPQVISPANIDDFHKWQGFLSDKGYSNYVEIVNAKNCGVAQNRERAFMVSILSNNSEEYNYKFPEPFPLKKTMADYLEDEVDEKYYLVSEKAEKLIDTLIDNGTIPRAEQSRAEQIVVDGTINLPREKQVANCIKARYDAGISNLRSDGTCVVEGK